ncbi:RDD family protein [Kitasatospora kifunensis]|uniref:RDD family protein n=1 Tax=Kitasatospora kifunensis TaxID=58351 RepID=UPI0028AEA3E6|nr:RDD family protein [Kitasatospora kifunensis]
MGTPGPNEPTGTPMSGYGWPPQPTSPPPRVPGWTQQGSNPAAPVPGWPPPRWGPLGPGRSEPVRPAWPGLASWDRRACGALLDIAVGAGAMTAYGYVLELFGPVTSLARLVLGAFGSDVDVFKVGFYAIFFGWWLWQWSLRGRTGQTLGQQLVGVRVVDVDTGRPIGPARSILRGLAHLLLDLGPVGLGFARPVWNRYRQTWSDTVMGTVAIEVEPQRYL